MFTLCVFIFSSRWWADENASFDIIVQREPVSENIAMTEGWLAMAQMARKHVNDTEI